MWRKTLNEQQQIPLIYQYSTSKIGKDLMQDKAGRTGYRLTVTASSFFKVLWSRLSLEALWPGSDRSVAVLTETSLEVDEAHLCLASYRH